MSIHEAQSPTEYKPPSPEECGIFAAGEIIDNYQKFIDGGKNEFSVVLMYPSHNEDPTKNLPDSEIVQATILSEVQEYLAIVPNPDNNDTVFARGNKMLHVRYYTAQYDDDRSPIAVEYSSTGFLNDETILSEN
jgi:hypothetical protein